MSMLLFYVGESGFAIESTHIIRVVPRVVLKIIPSMPNDIAGLLNLGGHPILVVDFCQLIEKRRTNDLLSSRIILIKNPRVESDPTLGILGEKVEQLFNISSENVIQRDFPFTSFSYLKRIFNRNDEIIQVIDVEDFFRFFSQLYASVKKEIYEP